ncbi:hypothetical protein KAM353_38270 [Aeromonas caviae]|nr:hypothetical protein KAM353_38270 [Aeromonas caviae]
MLGCPIHLPFGSRRKAMATHFQGRFEVEFKYRLTDSAAFVHTLTALSPEVMVADNHEQDCYFDTADGALARAEKSLIIRTMAPSGIRLWIVKGPGPDRCEAVNITDADKAASMVRTLGYQPVLTIDKRRSIYFLGAFHVTVDHLAGVGDFAELAIMTDDETTLPAYRAQLLALASRLGLAPEMRETRSYRTLCEQRAPPFDKRQQEESAHDRQTRLADLQGGTTAVRPLPRQGHLLHSGGQARAGRERRGGPRS